MSRYRIGLFNESLFNDESAPMPNLPLALWGADEYATEEAAWAAIADGPTWKAPTRAAPVRVT